MRPYDTIGRYGGEEFLVIPPEADPTAAFHIAERIRKGIDAQRIEVDGHEIHVTASFGVAASAQVDSTDPQTLLSSVDDALYRAQRNGRDRTELAAPPVPAADAPAGTGSHRNSL